ncbi:type II toxin-antitoxin system VapC family toxin [Neorhizobium galegae]|uniref:type II toxin-antitoxin system VapC family toxin n=1 Tax=Neorhizobium galegae TaxID=399 RepID=UPI000621238B|nr:type II toxin-antitoxin system VapC family toxin [Neorhizobium galegae]CDZ61211.1 Putative nucleic-acid-binding protein, contains PIN domain [Neorhizobium galegae bv. orientalis]KAB1124590.1 type II toxin-antitoxin system VapC family toxin [Neorhizobium galegae]MCQ1575040.1 type II toxin-antitoxin system VapC family toxin [Neorhizobium galegae]MCQ1810444.1 type II toxin-antitoxin system VapC family toxin [Neorhizobium galegae]UIK03860.1 type II toxin-antitoxin system VapC family toxin [Neor
MIVDTNVLVRAWADDQERQSLEARSQFATAEKVFVSNVALCEFVWVARQVYRRKCMEIAQAIRLLIADEHIVIDREAVEAGLAFLDAGGDFADGVIEFEGRRLGGDTFVSFDKRAVALIQAKGRKGILLDAD